MIIFSIDSDFPIEIYLTKDNLLEITQELDGSNEAKIKLSPREASHLIPQLQQYLHNIEADKYIDEFDKDVD